MLQVYFILSLPQLWNQLSLQRPWFFYWRMVFRKQVPGTKWAHYFVLLLLLEDSVRIIGCVHTYMCVHLHLHLSTPIYLSIYLSIISICICLYRKLSSHQYFWFHPVTVEFILFSISPPSFPDNEKLSSHYPQYVYLFDQFPSVLLLSHCCHHTVTLSFRASDMHRQLWMLRVAGGSSTFWWEGKARS